MAFGAYVHIPYCIQRCTYCDFATYEKSKILPPHEYVSLLLKEIEVRRNFFSSASLDTLYFGGGTPSLIDASLIVSIIKALEKNGYSIGPKAEVTIEINPATVDEEKLKIYLDNGVNRFSVGAQTFDDTLLKSVHREHSAKQTLQTLELLSKYGLNFSFDLLFALPGQNIKGLQKDIEILKGIDAKHISPYCLTVPSGHPLSKGRPPEDEQVDMFDLVFSSLKTMGYQQYEISNFAKPGYESQHNLLYWTDESWMALGLSAHGYARHQGAWGTRYWNLSNINDYVTEIQNLSMVPTSNISAALPAGRFEELTQAQALTDYCHTALRLMRGLDLNALEIKFGKTIKTKVTERLDSLLKSGLLYSPEIDRLALSDQGIVLSNVVFEKILFSDEDL